MTIYTWDGSSWTPVEQVDSSSGNPIVKVKRTDGWEIVYPPNITHIAVNSGSWHDTATWDHDEVPTDGASVLIRDGVSVTVDQVGTSRVRNVRVDGTLRHDPSSDSKLQAETIHITEAGKFEMGTDSTPIQPDVTAEIEFLDMGSFDSTPYEDRVGKGLIAHGDVEVVGAEKTSWDTLSQHPQSGDTSVTLDSSPTNWQAGDTIIVPGLESYDSSALDHNDEKRTITSVSGSTVRFDSALEHDHVPPSNDLPNYVMNLSRNARFHSESDDSDKYGHFMITSPTQTVKYLEAANMGRTEKARDPTSPNWGRGTPEPDSPPNPRARYPLHFHKTGPDEIPHLVKGCSIHGSPGWGVVNHGSNAEVEDCVSYDCLGAGFVAESGTEIGHFRRNFALRSEGSGENTESRKGWANSFANKLVDPPHNVDDFGHSGHGFWIHSPLVKVENNVAGGHRHTPITFWTRALHEEPLARDSTGDFTEFLDGKHDMFPKVRYEWCDSLQKKWAKRGTESPTVGSRWHNKGDAWVYGTSLPPRSFENNVAFGCGGGFDLRGGLGFRNQQSKLHRFIHSGNTSYNTGELWLADGSGQSQKDFQSSGNVGIDHRYVGNLLAKDYRLHGTGDGIAVYNNSTYIDDFHVEDATIENWNIGVVPSHYTGDSRTDIKYTTFNNNEIDIKLTGRFGKDGRLLAEGNSYSGNTHLHWDEIFVANMIPYRLLGGEHSSAQFEGRTVYHGWSDPNFVLVQKGDQERLNKMMNHGNEERWRENWLNGDDPRTVLPGTTHKELYNQYGLTFYGGMRDPNATDSERKDEFSGSGGTYDSTPFLGPVSKTMPTDEIWIDAVNEMKLSGNYEIIHHGDGAPHEEPIYLANDQSVVELRRGTNRNWSLPVTSTEGVASYTFSIDRTGEYHVHLRCQQGNSTGVAGQRDSRFYVRIDDGEWQLQDGGDGLAPMDDLVWPIVGEGGPRRYSKHNITSTGEHTIEIAGKGADMRLDWVLIKHELVAANPAGKGKPHTN